MHMMKSVVEFIEENHHDHFLSAWKHFITRNLDGTAVIKLYYWELKDMGKVWLVKVYFKHVQIIIVISNSSSLVLKQLIFGRLIIAINKTTNCSSFGPKYDKFLS